MAILGITKAKSYKRIPGLTSYISGMSKALPYLKPDKALLLQSSTVLIVCAMIDLFPGFFLGTFERYLELVPGLLILLPATVGLRGNTFGALAARLGSKLHLGTLDTSFRKNKVLRDQVLASTIQLMLLSTVIPLVGGMFAWILSLEIAPIHHLMLISMLGAILSGVFMFAISLAITFVSFRKGWDPDNVSAPIIASAGDILTIPIMFFAAWLTVNMSHDLLLVTSYTMFVAIILLILFSFVLVKGAHRPILRNAIPIALFAVLLSSVSGIILEGNFSNFFKGTVFLLLVPAFNGQGGSIGSILGSRLTSAAYLGTSKLTGKPSHLGVNSSFTLWLISLVVFSLMAGGALVLGILSGAEVVQFPELLITMLLGATLVTAFSTSVAYYTAYLSFRLGWDPDNVVIPLLTASMDIVGSGALIVGILATQLLF